MKELRSVYGDDAALVESKRKALLRLVDRFVREYGEADEIVLTRAPCRINLMGVHVEHRRGEVNYVTHCHEVMIAAQSRPDDRIVLRDTNARKFHDSEFDIPEEIARGDWTSWLDYIDSPGVKAILRKRKGHWSNYVKASALRLRHRSPRKKIRGMNVMLGGDIPICSGLSSSSAVVVASALAFQALNGLRIHPEEMVELCGEGEWYVGTRGGAGDHAAMLFGRRGCISHVRFFPFELLEYVPLPEGHRVVIANSLKRARKSGTVLSAYNETIAAYGTALMLIKHVLVDEMGFDRRLIDSRLNHLGDINLNPELFPDEVIYEMLGRMPQLITREELLARLHEERAELEKIFSTHDRPEKGYRSRAVAMFGLSEIARGHHCVKLLKSGDLRGFGKLMYVSHDGDRTVTWQKSGRRKPWDNQQTRVTSGYLAKLVAALKGDDPAKAQAAQLMFQPGGYRCSSEELDQIVDIAKRVKGVVGAGLTGAGFGGCVLILTQDSAVDTLVDELNEKYYLARGLPPSAEVCVPVEGAGLLKPK